MVEDDNLGLKKYKFVKLTGKQVQVSNFKKWSEVDDQLRGVCFRG